MSNLTPSERPLTPDQAYTAVMREAHAEQHVLLTSAISGLDSIKPQDVADTYKVRVTMIEHFIDRERKGK